MQINKLTEHYSVSPQIDAADLPAIAAAGFTTVICNRPDAEVPPSHHAATIAAAAKAAGLSFEVLELTHQAMTPPNIARQAAIVAASPGPVLAYCASGTRCSVIWALDQAGKLSTDEILATAARAGYQLDGMRATLDQIATT